MVKKIGVFIMIFGLLFVGIPRFNVNAHNNNINDVVFDVVNLSTNNEYGIPDEIYDAIYNDGWVAGNSLGYLEGFDAGEIYGLNDGYDIGYNQGYKIAYEIAYNYGLEAGADLDSQQAYVNGLEDGEDVGFALGYNQGYDVGETHGYNKGVNENDATGFATLLGTVFGGLGTLLSIELLPGIYIGAIIAVPLVFGIIFFILGKRKGD